MLCKLFQNKGNQGKYPNTFYKANTTLTAKTGKDSTKKLLTNVMYKHHCKKMLNKY